MSRTQISIVDGQQRLTTNYKAYTDSEDFRNIVLDLIKGRFLLVEGAIERYQIPVGKLLNKEDSVFYSYIMNSKYLRKENVLPVLLQCRTKIRNYYYTINQADDLSEDEQIEWFEVLNNAGSRVSALQNEIFKDENSWNLISIRNIRIFSEIDFWNMVITSLSLKKQRSLIQLLL